MILAPERQYVSQYATDIVGVAIHIGGVAADPDGSAVTATLVNEATGMTVFTRAATRMGTGLYQVQFATAESAQPGSFTLTWTYLIAGGAQSYPTYLLIGNADPAYDALAPEMKAVIDAVWLRFADTFDSPTGGPNLQTYFESHFTRGRIAQLTRMAVGRLNTVAQPYQTFTIDGTGGGAFPVTKWGALLEQAAYVETLKHLVRSYTEQPMFTGGEVTRLDRRDYMDRWLRVLELEEEELKERLGTFKIRNMFLGQPRVLVSGGVYGRYGPTRVSGSMAARPRYYSMFY